MKTIVTKSAIVTGASGGIGRVVAKRLASDGFAVAVHYAGNPAKAEAVVDEINNGGGKAIAVQADVAKAADVETFSNRRSMLLTRSKWSCTRRESCPCFQSLQAMSKLSTK
jgi:NADP-dependent 3-hydroxy acid dehydrogenase YdfG